MRFGERQLLWDMQKHGPIPSWLYERLNDQERDFLMELYFAGLIQETETHYELTEQGIKEADREIADT